MTEYQRRWTSASQERAYQAVVDVLRRHCDDHPETTSSDLLGILGKAAGYIVGLHEPEWRERARGEVTTNMDVATREVAGEQA